VHAEQRPRLRGNLKFVRHENEAGVSWVVKDPSTRKYFRFGQVEAWLMQQMDGESTLQQICDELFGTIGIRATPASLDVLVRRLRELGLVERSMMERSAMLVEQLRTQRRIRRESDNTLLRMRFSFGDPDALLLRMSDVLAFAWTRGFVLVSLAFFATYLFIVVTYWAPFSELITRMYHPATLTLPLLLLSYIIITAVAIIHEFGHGLTCKRFGGDVHELGAMLLYFMPSFYCNITDAWTFEKRSHRLWVTFAGGWIELWIAGLAALVWLATEPGTWINTLAAFTTATAGALSLLLNYNPLIPLDGYYALVDWLEMPNLRGRSFDYLGAVVRRSIFRLDTHVPPVTDRERRILMAYGIAAITYSTLLLGLVAVFATGFMVARLGAWGGAIMLILLFVLTHGPRAAVAGLIRRVVAEKLPRGARLRRVGAGAGIGAVALLALAAVTPWTVRAPAAVIVEPAVRTWLRPAQEARLTEVRVREGQGVRVGDTLAVLRDRELELERVRVLSAVQSLEARAAAGRARGDAAGARAAEMARDAERGRLRVLDAQRDGLIMRAPADGVMATPLLEERVGATIAAGDSLLEVWSPGELRARIAVPAARGGEVRAGASLRVRFPAWPGVTWHTAITRVEPAASGDLLVALAMLPSSPDYPLLAGMTGRGRVDITRTTITGATMRTVRRLRRLELFL
jgi:putative peptide zinc metalloprotease protein